MSLIQLLRSRRFLPLFLTQFLGAFNDNVYKNALVILITFKAGSLWGLDSNQLVVLSGGLFILPFFLFSAYAGQVADKYERAFLVRQVKLAEVLIMALALWGFYREDFGFLVLVLFLMGTQSSLFGPLKYSVLPQLLHRDELTGGNALVSMATFLAILLGTVAGGLVVDAQPHGPLWVAATVVGLALLGWFASWGIAPLPVADPGLKLHWNGLAETWRILGYAREKPEVFVAVLAVSWFWLVGATLLSQFPAYGKSVLGGNAEVVTLLLTLFSVGIGLGSLLCNRLSRGRVEPALVPLGALGISVFCLDLYWVAGAGGGGADGLMGAWEFLRQPAHWRPLLDLFLLSVCGGLYIVPLQALVQQRSEPRHLARIIAANNILNALFMVVSALATLALLRAGSEVTEIFAWVGGGNLLVLGLLLWRMPEFGRRWTRLLFQR